MGSVAQQVIVLVVEDLQEKKEEEKGSRLGDEARLKTVARGLSQEEEALLLPIE